MPGDDSICTDEAPAPVGAYPHARRVGELLFLSGIGPRPVGGGPIPGVDLASDGSVASYDIELQSHAVIRNVRAVLAAAGADLRNLVDVTVFLTDIPRDFAAYNAVYAEYFDPETGPCRTTVEVTRLPTPIAIEMKCVASLAAADRTSP